MQYDLILIRYGELALKTQYVRRQFTSRLIRNIENAFIQERVPCQITPEWGRLYVHTSDIDAASGILRRIMGITSISPCMQTTNNVVDIGETAVVLTKDLIDSTTTFAVRAHRVGEHDYNSQEVGRDVGSAIVEATQAPVNLRSPDVEIGVDVRFNKTYVYVEKKQGSGGLPLGTQGKVLSLITDAPSLLSTWYLARRGCTPIPLIADMTLEEQLRSFLTRWFIPTKHITRIDPSADTFLTTLADLTRRYKTSALVSSQTLQNDPALAAITDLDTTSELPVLHPLIAMTREEIASHLKDLEEM